MEYFNIIVLLILMSSEVFGETVNCAAVSQEVSLPIDFQNILDHIHFDSLSKNKTKSLQMQPSFRPMESSLQRQIVSCIENYRRNTWRLFDEEFETHTGPAPCVGNGSYTYSLDLSERELERLNARARDEANIEDNLRVQRYRVTYHISQNFNRDQRRCDITSTQRVRVRRSIRVDYTRDNRNLTYRDSDQFDYSSDQVGQFRNCYREGLQSSN